MFRIPAPLVALCALVVCSVCIAAQAPSYRDGQTIQVREGDRWSGATIVKREGRKYLIRYDGATDEEWVTADRLREAPGKSGAAAANDDAANPPADDRNAPDAGASAPKRGTAAEGKSGWEADQTVEVKRGLSWRESTVVKQENGWVLVRYNGVNTLEWVEPWRIREKGSQEDNLGTAPSHFPAKPDQAAPAQAPEASPSPKGAGTASAGTGDDSGAGDDAAGGDTSGAWRDPKRGDRVILPSNFGNNRTGRVVQMRPGQLLVSIDNDRGDNPEERWMDVRDVRVLGLRWDVKVGQRVSFRDFGGWVNGTVVEREPERAKVVKDGQGARKLNPNLPPRILQAFGNQGRWFQLDQLRPASAADVPSLASNGEPSDELRAMPGYMDADLSEVEEPATQVEEPTTKPSDDAYPSSGTNHPVTRSMAIRGASGDSGPIAIVAPRAASPLVVVGSQASGVDQVSIDRFDADAGRPMGGADVPVTKDMRLTDVSPDGTRVLFRKLDQFGHGSDRVEIWRIGQGKPVRELLMFPYATVKQSDKMVQSAAFIANDRIVTASSQQLVLWDTTTGKAVYAFPYDGNIKLEILVPGAMHWPFFLEKITRMGISATGKYIAFTTGKEALVIHAATGKALLQLPEPLVQATQFAFTPGGKQLLACDARMLWVVDLASGKLISQFGLPGNITPRELSSPAEGYALVNNTMLVDLQHSCPVWKYELPDKALATVLPSGRFVCASEGNGSVKAQQHLVGAMIPQAAVVKAAQGLQTTELVIKPGTSVSLQVNLQACNEKDRAAAKQHLTEELQRIGMTIADAQQPVQLLASVELGQTEERSYGSGMFDRLADKLKMTPKLSRLQFLYKGKPVWEATASSIDPGAMLFRGRGQTQQQAMDEQTRPNMNVFIKIRLPAYVLMPQKSMYLGATAVSAQSMRDKKPDPEPDPLKGKRQPPPNPQEQQQQQRRPRPGEAQTRYDTAPAGPREVGSAS